MDLPQLLKGATSGDAHGAISALSCSFIYQRCVDSCGFCILLRRYSTGCLFREISLKHLWDTAVFLKGKMRASHWAAVKNGERSSRFFFM